jgi:hypothetical protein
MRIVPSILRGASLAVAMAGGWSCGGDGTSAPTARNTASLAVLSGDKQIGAAGSILKSGVVVEARSAAGAPVPGAIIAFEVTTGGGSVSALLDTSDASGRVAAAWTMGTRAGEAQELTVTVLSATDARVAPAIVTASVTPADPAGLEAIPAALTGRVGEALPPIRVIANDRFGNRAPAAAISITARLDASAPVSIVTPPSVTSDSLGVTLDGIVIAGRAGAAALIIESVGLTAARVSLALAGGKPQRLDVTSGASVDAVAGAAGPPVSVRVADAWDNAVAGVEVTFTIDGIGSIGRATTAQDGIATLSTWTAPALGTYRITASIVGGALSAQVPLATHPGAPTTLTALSSNPTSGTAGTEVLLAVRATDVAGNVVPNTVLTWTWSTLSGQSFTDDAGVARFAAKLATKAGPSQVVVSAGSTASATLNVQILAGPFWGFARLSDTISVAAGSTLTFTHTALDQYKNPIPGLRVYAVADSRSERISTVATTDAAGTATFTVGLDPYAATIFFGIGLDHAAGPYAATVVFAAASRGAFRLAGPETCPPLNSPGFVSGWMYGPSGHPAVGVSMTLSVQPGNGYLYGLGPIIPASTVTQQSINDGFVSVGWSPPNGAGTYSVVGTPPGGYDAILPILFTCHIT